MKQFANLIWLIPVATDRLIVKSPVAGDLAAVFKGLFAEIIGVTCWQQLRELHKPEVNKDRRDDLACTVILDFRFSDLHAIHGDLGKCLEQSVPGSWIVILAKTSPLRFRRTVLRLLHDKSFSVRSWYVSTSIEDATEFVPVSRQAVYAWNGSAHRNRLRRLVRNGIIRTGFHHFFFGEMIIAAQV